MSELILAIKTSDDKIELGLINEKQVIKTSQAFGRQMSRNILRFIKDFLDNQSVGWNDLTGIVAFRGEGSYTSLRIGITVANTLADGLGLPIIGATGDDWLEQAVIKIKQGQNHKIIKPFYRQPAVITKPKK